MKTDTVKQAMIFAAGLGTRLRPLTDTMPKALVPVAGVPLLERLLLRLRDAGYTRAVVNVHHFADQVEEFVRSREGFGLEVRISDERDLLRETGGGIRHAAPLFDPDAPLLVHNVDILSNLDLTAFSAAGTEEDAARLLVSARKTSRYLLFDGSDRLCGWVNLATGEVKSPSEELLRIGAELGAEELCRRYRARAFAGIHLLAPAIWQGMVSWPERFSIIDYYLSVCRELPVRGVEVPGFRMIDVGKADSLREAEAFAG